MRTNRYSSIQGTTRVLQTETTASYYCWLRRMALLLYNNATQGEVKGNLLKEYRQSTMRTYTANVRLRSSRLNDTLLLRMHAARLIAVRLESHSPFHCFTTRC